MNEYAIMITWGHITGGGYREERGGAYAYISVA